MKEKFTKDEIKKLRFLSRYMLGHGITSDMVDISLDFCDYSPNSDDLKSIDLNGEVFNRNYQTVLPESVVPVLHKCLELSGDKLDNFSPDVDYINYGTLEISMDARENRLEIDYFYTYYEQDDPNGVTYDASDDEDTKKIIDIVMGLCDEDEVELRYNGSGDSGYIEGQFENCDESVPAEVEDWCYRELEQFGGWEINEGSQGTFYFYNDRIELSHIYNVERSERVTLFEIEY